MKKVISTIVATSIIASVLVNTAYAGGRHGGGVNPLWIPVAVLSTLVAAATIADSNPVVYERRIYVEPRQTVIYEEPRRYRHEQSIENRPDYGHNCNEHDRAYESPRYRDYR
jgi:hypothetical protein